MGVFNDIKSRLGFSGEAQDARYDDEYYDQEEYNENYDNVDYDQGYESYADYGSSRGAGYRGSQSEIQNPRLVSMDDVRAHTQIPESLQRDPLPPRQATTPGQTLAGRPFQSDNYRKVERASDYMRSTDTSDVAPMHGSSRHLNYDAQSSSASSNLSSVGAVSARASYDPYEAYSGAGLSSHNPSRSLTVLKPISYAEVERIAKILKAGDVVILALTHTQDQLAKRILDFSFGVSSALDASVECIADKVFVINRGRALSEEELSDLRRGI